MSAVSAGVPAVLDARGLVRAFGDERAVDGVALTVMPGEIHALVGLNGAGKTTLMRLLLGMLTADEGSVTLRLADETQATDIRTGDPRRWAHVGHLIETPFAYAELTVTETIRAAARLRGMAPDEAREATCAVIEDLALGHWAGRRSRSLSLGNRQRLGLACAVVHRPQVLVLDEPANALDPAGVLRVRRQLVDQAGRGASILVSSHHLDEMARVAHRITVMHRGRVVGGLPPGGSDLERQFFEIVYAAEDVPAEVT